VPQWATATGTRQARLDDAAERAAPWRDRASPELVRLLAER
jgi:hypothetical protein